MILYFTSRIGNGGSAPFDAAAKETVVQIRRSTPHISNDRPLTHTDHFQIHWKAGSFEMTPLVDT
jgi:hypothetical protein